MTHSMLQPYYPVLWWSWVLKLWTWSFWDAEAEILPGNRGPLALKKIHILGCLNQQKSKKYSNIIWVFPKNWGIPKGMVYNGSNPIKMDDLGGKFSSYFWKPSICKKMVQLKWFWSQAADIIWSLPRRQSRLAGPTSPPSAAQDHASGKETTHRTEARHSRHGAGKHCCAAPRRNWPVRTNITDTDTTEIANKCHCCSPRLTSLRLNGLNDTFF